MVSSALILQDAAQVLLADDAVRDQGHAEHPALLLHGAGAP